MIVVVTGPSAAGKTTWCRRHHPAQTVPEHAPAGAEPADPAAQAVYWCAAGCDRWAAARDLERRGGLAVCDDDPLKLHYTWSMLRAGLGDRRLWDREVAAHRSAVAAGRLGFADLYLVSVPPEPELRRRREADRTRTRRNFERHVRLAAGLREWYATLDRLSPGRTRWHLPPDGAPATDPRARREDPALLDALLDALPPADTSDN
ncbi:hypothetical protein [Spirilliplanes yamanashiensis]|uniref:AAA domain-containing protein n=1 Tax=Spirilliplanes yamanashiensis TaxID=42233 RepID=A0A8J4DKT5_9ACTN|nr:hypothetical protein [Spirilliplanes yamanashiensis]MDP9817570.1 hypothetical protein [Spirilliplanes yamanashiensis]GIJ04380.1 hypothetical protein Sya03_37320 [Spirilliplanes yamanashiensis]